MSSETIRIVAPTLDEAKIQAEAKVKQGFRVVSRYEIKEESEASAIGHDQNEEYATCIANGNLPKDIKFKVTRHVVCPAIYFKTLVEATTEENAKSAVKSQLSIKLDFSLFEFASVKAHLTRKSSKGIFGFKKTLPLYKVEVATPFIVHIYYLTKEAACELYVTDEPEPETYSSSDTSDYDSQGPWYGPNIDHYRGYM